MVFCAWISGKRTRICIYSLCMAAVGINPAYAQVRLPALFGDHAMFQADKPVTVWGWAEPGAQVKVELRSEDGNTIGFAGTADATGRWSGHLRALKSGTSGQLVVTTDKGDKIVSADILVGEVWLCGGQSNMEYDVAGTGRTDLKNPEEVAEVEANVATAKSEAEGARPPIRYFKVLFRRASQPMNDVQGKWVLADAGNVPRFSAVAWNFAVALENKIHSPIGLIVSSVGNTPIETWMSKEALAATPVGTAIFKRSEQELAAATAEKIARYKTDLAAWEAANPTQQLQAENERAKPVAPPNLSAANYVPNQYYNGMIRGLEPYAIRGVIWYQGAGNFMHPLEYSELFLALIKGWRGEWKEPTLPFYFVEESNFGAKQIAPVEPNPFSLIREQQHAALTLPAVDMICSIDLGNGNGHYPNKKAAGERLAGLALRYTYHRPGQVDSPRYKSFDVNGNRIELRFTDARGLHVRDGEVLRGFAIRGAKGTWVWASGRIEGQRIILWSDQVSAPIAARYAWAVNPITSVENGSDLPLCPFRTDLQ